MTKKEELFYRYLYDECSVEEIEELIAEFSAEGNESELRRIIRNQFDKEDENLDLVIPGLEAKQQAIFKSIGLKMAKKGSLFPWVAIAAALLIIFSVAGYLRFHDRLTGGAFAQVKDIDPGINGATLILADGRKVSLNDKQPGMLARQGSTRIQKTVHGTLIYTAAVGTSATASINTLLTKRKEQYQLTLPDGTRVWLNAASSLRFPTSFNGKERLVRLDGEAYFEVAKDALKPFKVQSNGQTVKVMGTHFNVNAYQDESETRTTLLEGSIKIAGTTASGLLTPGQQGVLTGSDLKITEANTEEAIAWKNGYFRFNSENIESIMRKLSRWYDIEVSFEGNIKSKSFTGKISRFKKISQVLKMLGKTKAVKFKVEERRVVVSE